MKQLPRLLLFVAVALGVAACGGNGVPKSVPSDSIAVVGNEKITKNDFNSVLDQAKRSYKAQHRPFPKAGTAAYAALRGNIVEYLVEKVEYEIKGKEMGVKITDKQVNDRLDQIKKQYFPNPPGQPPPSKQEIERRYRKQIASQGLTDKEVRDGIRVQLLREAIYKKVTDKVSVSDTDVKKYYEKNKAQYEQPALPESRDVRHILFKPTQHALALSVYNQLKHGADFVKMVQKYSIDTSSKALGGKLTICRKQAGSCIKTVPQFEKVAFALKTGEISTPVRSQYGWHIIQALGPVKPPQAAKPTPYSQVKELIRQQLLQQKKQKVMTDWWNKTKKEFSKKIKYQAGYEPPASATTSGP